MDPLDYLIEDCWQHLFQFLPAGDKHSLCQTCTSFQAMLEPQKVKWAFELILPHILKIEEFQDVSMFGYSKIVGLSWRLVCKSWKVGVDNYCRSIYDGCIVQWRIRSKYNFCDVTALEQFLTVFKEHNGNPFIGRKVRIFATSIEEEHPLNEEKEDSTENSEDEIIEEVGGEERDDAAPENENNEERDAAENEDRLRRERIPKHRELTRELVSKYGEEIECLTVCNRTSGNRPVIIDLCTHLDSCKFLQFVLCHTPNLQRVIFSLNPDRHLARENTDSLESELTKYFDLNPLPHMPRLRELFLHHNPPKMETLLLETYGQNLQSLYTSHSSEISTAVWSNLRCLKSLTLIEIKFHCSEKLLRSLQSPLESLHITEKRETGGNSDKFFMIDKFLLAIQHLPLKEVTVHPAYKSLKESTPFPKSFPQHPTLESFCLRIRDPKIISLDFLLFLPKLKSLEMNTANVQLHSILQLIRSRSSN